MADKDHIKGRIWTEEEIQFIRDKWPTLMTTTEIATHLGRTRKALICKVNELKIFSANKPWPKLHDDFVFENYPTDMSVSVISETVKRPIYCVHSKARKLGVCRPKHKKLTRLQSEFIRDNWRTMAPEQLAESTGLSLFRVKSIMDARRRAADSVSAQERELRAINTFFGNEKEIARLYRGKRYQDVKLKST